jgi:hypothetical protein
MNSSVQPVARPAPVAETRRQTRAPFGIALWLLLSASMTSGGWILSAFHQLNARGYAVWLLLTAAAIFWWMKSREFADLRAPRLSKLIRRFKRPLPLGYLILAALALLGGLIYAPTNYDALAYRIPRVQHWLAEGHWLWIHTLFHRLNVRACGAEWLAAPFVALTGGIRWLFIPSIISYLLLPGLLFSVFTRFGIRRKIAWHWMWIIATAYGYVTQAGSVGNDLLGAVYVLAAFDFALRLRQSQRMEDAWLFLIAAGLMTGAKASNCPLMLPLFLIVYPGWRLLLAKPIQTAIVLGLSALVSLLPTAVLNFKNCHDWTGMSLEGPMVSPVKQLVANIGVWTVQNLFPPIFPLAAAWNHSVAAKASAALGVFPDAFNAPELVIEEGGALGMGICLLLVISCAASYCIRKRSGRLGSYAAATLWDRMIWWSPYVSLLVFGLKAEVVGSSGRLLIPYYPVLVVPPLLLLEEGLFRRRWWKGITAAVFGIAILVVILSPARPLWPAQTVLARLKQSHPSSRLLARAEVVYSVYATRANGFGPLVAELPADATVVGFVSFDDPETSLWWPMGSRRIEHVTPDDTRQRLEARGIKYIIISSQPSASALPGTVADFLGKYDAEIIKTVPLFLRAGQGLTDWHIVQLRPR